MIPVAVVIGLVGLGFARGASRRRRGRDVVAFVVAAAAAGAVIFLVLVLRGEAGAYLATLRENRTYASHALTVEGWSSGVRGHLQVIREFLPDLTRDLTLSLVAVLVVLLVASVEVRARFLRSRLLELSLVGWLSTLLVLGATAFWDQHLELLAFPLLCTAALALACVRTATRRDSSRILERLAVCIVAGGCLLAAGWPQHPIENVRRWNDPPESNVSDALRRAARSAPFRGTQVSYAHLGANDEQGAGAFVDDSFRLACARFHQYPFIPPRALSEVIRCLETQRPLLVAVTPTFAIDSYTFRHRDTPVAWQRFVRDGETYLRSHCRPMEARPGVRIYGCGGSARR